MKATRSSAASSSSSLSSSSLFDSEPEPKMTIGALSPWYGSNRMLAPVVGKMLGRCDWAGVVFSGGMAEVPHIQAREILVNDLHRDIINLARVMREPAHRAWLVEQAEANPFHPDILAEAQAICKATAPPMAHDAVRALWYFVAVWMGRSAKAGTDEEFDGKLSARFTASGGGSNVRYRSAIKSAEAWGKVLAQCEFSVKDFREYLGDCHDRNGHGIYSDAPFPDAGDGYRHKFTTQDHRDLARLLAKFRDTRVVCRFYDHPLIRELYPAPHWRWHVIDGGRTQANKAAPEVLLVNQE